MKQIQTLEVDRRPKFELPAAGAESRIVGGSLPLDAGLLFLLHDRVAECPYFFNFNFHHIPMMNPPHPFGSARSN